MRNQPNRQVSSYASESKASDNESERSNPDVKTRQTIEKGWHTEEREHHRKERFYWKLTSILTFFAVAGAIATVILSLSSLDEARKAVVEARRQADIAKDAYIATTRAWINVGVDESTMSLTWEKNVGPGVTATVKGINEGSSPAIQASVSLHLAPADFGSNPDNLVKEACVSWTPLYGNIVLMKGEIQDSGTVYLPWDKIKKSKDFSASITGRREIPDGFVFLYVISCVQYRIIGDKEWHHTGKIYQLAHAGPIHQNTIEAFKVGDGLKPGSLRLKSEDAGDYVD